MKHQIKKSMFLPFRFGSALTGLLLLGTAAYAPAQCLPPQGGPGGFGCQQPPAQVLPPRSMPYGLSYAEWSAKWWQWDLEQSTNHLEEVGAPRYCDGPDNQVKFLLGAYLTGGIGIQTNQITIPAGTPLFFPVLATWSDNSGCPTFSTYTADQLAAQVEGMWPLVTVTTCTIDGVAVPGLSNPGTNAYLTLSPPFSYTTAEEGNVLAGIFGDTCIDGGTTIYPAEALGVYLMLAPLSPGHHTIHTLGVVGPVAAPYVEEDITYDITVTRDDGHDGNDGHGW
jgi:hypothetical protein